MATTEDAEYTEKEKIGFAVQSEKVRYNRAEMGAETSHKEHKDTEKK